MALKKREDGRYKVTYTYHGKRHYFYGNTRNEATAKRDIFMENVKKAPNMDANVTTGWMNNILSMPKQECPKQRIQAMRVLYVYILSQHLAICH